MDYTASNLEKIQATIHIHMQLLSEIHDQIKEHKLQNQFDTNTLLLLSTIKFFAHK